MMVTTVSGGLQWEVIVEQVLLTMMVTTVSGSLQWEVIVEQLLIDTVIELQKHTEDHSLHLQKSHTITCRELVL